MIFRQLFDPETSTYTYLLADSETREAVLIDTVLERLSRDLLLVRELELDLRYTLETHVHADHVTASGRFREEFGSKIVVGAHAGVENADLALSDGDHIRFGRHDISARLTPGHTSGCVTYFCSDGPMGPMAFTGDALLVRGCGRTDFQQGDAAKLFESVRGKIFSLPDSTLLYPGHDYQGRTVTTVAEEKRFNPRLGLDKSGDDFVAIMNGLKLANPRRMHVAVPANLKSGLYVPAEAATVEPPSGPSVAAVVERLGRQDAELSMGGGI